VARKKHKWKADEDEGGYITVYFELLDHPAFRKISDAAIRVLIHCFRKAYGPGRYKKVFKFSYPEARKKLGISDSTFRRAMMQLHSGGFIDYFSPGGLRCDPDPAREGKKKKPKGYQLSLRWKKWGTSEFEKRRDGHFTSIHG
jgi:hypothetical protein